MASNNENGVSLKLLIDIKGERVLFAEAGKEFVDFLFHLFSLPLGAVASLITKEKMVGCLGKLYGSIEDLNNTYFHPSAKKDILLNSKTPTYSSNAPLILLPNNPSSSEKTLKKLYCCPNIYNSDCYRVADDPKVLCPNCRNYVNKELTYVPSGTVATPTGEEKGGGYVKGVVTYMIMDDLQVKPMSTISSVTLLNTFNVKDLGSLEEKVVYLTMDEGLKLLKASLQSETVLTDVFLPKKTVLTDVFFPKKA